MRFARTNSILTLALAAALVFPASAYGTDSLQTWVAVFNGPGSPDDRAWDVEIDPMNNIYVVGASGYDVALVKYDSDRNVLWQNFLGVHTHPYLGLDRSFVELDQAGNAYVAYTELDEGTFPCEPRECMNIVTRKYSPSGVLQWERKHGPQIDIYPIADLRVDAEGDIYVATRWNGLLKYDTNGVEQWSDPVAWNHDIFEIEFDAAGNISVTGRRSAGPGATSLFTSIYSPEGDLVARDVDTNQRGIDGGLAVATDGGATYVAGLSILGSNNIIKYKSELNCPPTLDYCWLESDWTARFGTTATWEQPNSIAVDNDGNVYVSGSSRLTDTSRYDCLTAKYDPSGTKLWEARYDADNMEDLDVDMALDDDGNVYVACQSVEDSPLQRDYATIAYDSDGNRSWVQRYDGPANGSDFVSDIEVDSSGHVYVTGYISTSDGFDFGTVKYSELTIPDAIAGLIFAVRDMALPHGIERSLLAKIENASSSLDEGRDEVAVNQLQALMGQVEDIRGVKLTDGQADELITRAQQIIYLVEQGSGA